MLGLVIAANFRAPTREVERPTPPILWVRPRPDEPPAAVHEIWFWDAALSFWFVMCADPAAMMSAERRTAGFYIGNTKDQLIALREQWWRYLCSTR